MRERLRQFGGQLEISSTPGLTLIVATLSNGHPRTKSASPS